MYSERATNYSQPSIDIHSKPQFDIITATIKPSYNLFNRIPLPKLGNPKDYKKQFHTITDQYKHQQYSFPQNQIKTINSSSTKYNIINHSQNKTPPFRQTLLQKKNVTFRHDSLSKIYDLGRLCAPNYDQQYTEKYNHDQQTFHRKKGNCGQIFQIGKGYGPRAKYFRQFK